MNYLKSTLIILMVLIFLLTVAIANLAAPTDAYAHPAYGFTPPPPPGDGGDDDGGDDDRGSDDDDGKRDDTIPPDYILVELDRCDLSCSIEYGEVNVGQMAALLPPPEVRVRVQLVHQGSGWIAEHIISDMASTRLAVPYPGQWDVFMVDLPELMTVTAVDTSNLNLDYLSTSLTTEPIHLGVVEANTAEPQLVKCPLECVVDPPPMDLPVTGTNRSTAILILLTNSAFILIVGLLMYEARKRGDESNRLGSWQDETP